MNDLHDLALVLKSRVPIVVIETFEEDRAMDLLNRVALKEAMVMHAWTVTDGIFPLGFSDDSRKPETSEPENVLKAIKEVQSSDYYVLCDFHPYLDAEHPKLVRLVKDIALSHRENNKTLIFLSHKIEIPPELKRFCAWFEMSMPSDEQILSIIREEAKAWSSNNRNARVKTDNQTLQKIVHNLKGLTHNDVRMLARGLISDDGAITDNDIPEISKAKFQLLDMEGVLSFEYDTEHFRHVGGLANLKEWLAQRKNTFIKPGSNTDIPKGILLLGVQGSGKSLAAKAVAGMWGLPLLRLDFAALYNKYIGESERNLREAIKMADLMAPCVLWLDEIEKGMAQQNSDGGTSQRILGTLLTWMAERKKPVFIVATSNDISALPPELIRKGRVDEIFFVDLPDREIREEIFRIHLGKRNLPEEGFNTGMLAELTEGFSGAEIEQCIVSAVYRAGADEASLSDQHLVNEINNTSPISIVMAEQIADLRAWASERTVPAN